MKGRKEKGGSCWWIGGNGTAGGWYKELGRRTERLTEEKERQLTLESLNAAEAEQEALCKHLLVCVSKR